MIFSTSVLTLVFLNLTISYSFSMRADLESSPSPSDVDRFGIKKIYATKEFGREWFLNMSNPFDDNLFSSTFGDNITRQPDGGWKISQPAVRLNVNTPPGLQAWKDVEITGYAKIVSIMPYNNLSIDDADLSWYARVEDITQMCLVRLPLTLGGFMQVALLPGRNQFGWADIQMEGQYKRLRIH